MKKTTYILMLLSLLVVSCSKNINPIEYGSDACDFCRMTIVSQTHAAQVVTKKGKNYKFDASECLIHFLEKNAKEEDMLHVLSADFMNPGELIDSRNATFVISQSIPSPMGAFLSAVQNKESAEKLISDNSGEMYSWSEVKEVILANNPLGEHH